MVKKNKKVYKKGGTPTDKTDKSPPNFTPPKELYMKAYIQNIRKVSDKVELMHKAAGQAKHRPNSRIVCSTPLTDQINGLMRSLPPAQRDRYWSMDDLTARLQGRYNARPCAGEVGQALRQLGWTQRRDWSQDGGGRRVWGQD